mgnify:CR=1 FL=1
MSKTSDTQTRPHIIPRELLLGNPRVADLQISPDGEYLSWLAPSEHDVLNVWIAPRESPEDARQITTDDYRGIRMYLWSYDGSHLLYVQDKGGDENFHLYSVHRAGGQETDLTPFEGVRVGSLTTHPDHPDTVLVGLNKRDPSLFDLHRLSLSTGTLELAAENPGDVADWKVDRDLRVRLHSGQEPNTGDTIIRYRSTEQDEWSEILRAPINENLSTAGFAEDGRNILVMTSVGSDTEQLVLFDPERGEAVETIFGHERADIGSLQRDKSTGRLEAVAVEYERVEWFFFDKAMEQHFAQLRAKLSGDVHIASRDLSHRYWIVSETRDSKPAQYHIYDTDTHEVRFLFSRQPALAEYECSPMKPVHITARDGLDLISYLTLPVGEQSGPLPMVLYVHGGPWARDSWGFDPMAQLLANRGYAVLQVNFRASVGFGKAFLNAGDRQWGKKMQDDLSDAVQWAVDEGIADPQRVAIMGGSYGGYATLAGLTFTPDLYACGVDIVGPSQLKTLLQTIPPYWKVMKQQLIVRMGDVENDEDFNRERSPLFHADRIRVPLLIGQGQNDPRVKVTESDQIVEAMRQKDLPVTYVVFPDEGHGFARPENRLDFYGRVEEFLAEHLGGRAEAHKAIEGSTAELR